ncbi:MAG TPA: L-threonylcarbamoyladenylate synthase [Desulfomonilaceae bacterium]|nr:L-threonylcarbamoyladenylate synthase [Desulfomonilaceae bacterium]
MSETHDAITRAGKIIRSGGVVLVPTETFYALAADPFREKAVARIFRIKCRDEKKPLPLIASRRSVAEPLIHNPGKTALLLMDGFWPGSLTMVFDPAVDVPKWLKGPGGKIGVRVPPDCPARDLAEESGGWITATSANLSGGPDPQEIASIARQVVAAVDAVIDLGPTPGGAPSTVVELLNSDIRIIRHGAVTESALRELVGAHLT